MEDRLLTQVEIIEVNEAYSNVIKKMDKARELVLTEDYFSAYNELLAAQKVFADLITKYQNKNTK